MNELWHGIDLEAVWEGLFPMNELDTGMDLEGISTRGEDTSSSRHTSLSPPRACILCVMIHRKDVYLKYSIFVRKDVHFTQSMETSHFSIDLYRLKIRAFLLVHKSTHHKVHSSRFVDRVLCI